MFLACVASVSVAFSVLKSWFPNFRCTGSGAREQNKYVRREGRRGASSPPQSHLCFSFTPLPHFTLKTPRKRMLRRLQCFGLFTDLLKVHQRCFFLNEHLNKRHKSDSYGFTILLASEAWSLIVSSRRKTCPWSLRWILKPACMIFEIREHS